MSTDDSTHSRLYLNENMATPQVVELPEGMVCVYSAASPAKSAANEDAAAILHCRETLVLVVADGMGGGAGGRQAAEIAVREMHAALDEARLNADMLVRTAIINGFDKANASVLQLGIGAATTLAVVEIHRQSMRSYHAGDSRILVTGARGRIKLETGDHSPVGYAVEAGLLSPDEAMYHCDRHLVSNVVGAADMRVEIGPCVELRAKDSIIVASDGVFDNLHVEEIVETICRGTLDKAAESLVTDLRARMLKPHDAQPSKPDDATCILYRPRS